MHQLETLAEQIASVIPVQTQTVGTTVSPIPGIHPDVLETRRGLKATQRIVPPLVPRTRTYLYLPLYVPEMVAHITDAVLPEPLFSKEPAQGIIGFPPVPSLGVAPVITLELAGQCMPPVAVAGLGVDVYIQITLLRLGIVQLQRQRRTPIPDPVLDDRLRLHYLPQTADAYGLRRALTIDQNDLAIIFGSLNAPGVLSIVAGLDQQGAIAFQGANTFDVHRYLPGKLRVKDQPVTLHELDASRQAVAIIQPQGIGNRREREQHG